MGTRGFMTRSDRQMIDADTRAFLRQHSSASVGTLDSDGWPYVVPLMYVYEEGERLFLHTGNGASHFRSNISANSKICVTVTEQGSMQQGSLSPCDSALVYRSAIVFGQVRVCEGPNVDEEKALFFDRLLKRLGDAPANYSSGYTMLKQIVLYEVAIEIMTGKINVGLHD